MVKLPKLPTSGVFREYLAAIIANLCTFCMGSAIAWMTTAERHVMTGQAYSFTPTETQWHLVSVLLPLGAAICCLPTGALMQVFGCKKVMLAQILPYLLGWVLLIFANSIECVYVGRFLMGMCAGAIYLVVPIYSNEICQVKRRGAIGSLFYGFALYGGMVGFAMTDRLKLWISNMLNLLLGLSMPCVLLLPESPCHYIYHGKVDKALRSFQWLRGADYNAQKEITLIMQSATKSELSLRHGWCGTMKRSRTVRSTSRAVSLLVLHQLCGITIAGCYLKQIVQEDAKQPLCERCMLLLFLCIVLGYGLCFVLIDRLGRRPLLLISAIICFCGALAEVINLQLFNSSFSEWRNLGPLMILLFGYSLGLGPVSWVVSVELIVVPIRAIGVTTAVCCNWILASIMTFWYEFDRSPLYVFVLIVIASITAIVLVLSLLPETKMLTPAEIQERLKSITGDIDSSGDSD
ncbi:glucose transporter type 3 [Drosophila busckii]|uniref:glucose transporter type 3 n=1 Tax=Drosophila busckii TaxID=30019 RepID=UPI00083EDA4A|nr:glucose transporter type 3 [Drosophila busckii]